MSPLPAAILKRIRAALARRPKGYAPPPVRRVVKPRIIRRP